MKIIYTLLFFILFFISGFSQVVSLPTDKDTTIRPPQKISINNENPAEFTGEGGITNFLANNLIYPKKALENQTEGTILVRFVVEKDGSVSGVKIIGTKKNGIRVNELGNGLEEEAIRVIKETNGLWKSGEINGIPVSSFFTIPISFRILEEEKKKTDTHKPYPLLTE